MAPLDWIYLIGKPDGDIDAVWLGFLRLPRLVRIHIVFALPAVSVQNRYISLLARRLVSFNLMVTTST